MKNLPVMGLLVLPLLCAEALACIPEAPLRFEHDANSDKTYVAYAPIGNPGNTTGPNWINGKKEIALGKDYRLIVESEFNLADMDKAYQELEIHSRYASDGINAYVIDYGEDVRQIIGARDYPTLTPVQNVPIKGASRYHWRYYRDKFSFYSAEVVGQQTILKPLADYTNQFRVIHGLLVIKGQVYIGSQLLAIKGSELKLTPFNDKFDFISDGKATYATRNMDHVKDYRPDIFFDRDQEVDGPQTWYGQLGWVKLVDHPKIKLLGSVHNKYSGSTCGNIHRYDVIFESNGQLYFNKTALISSSASHEAKLAAIMVQLQKFHLSLSPPTQPAEKPAASQPVSSYDVTVLHYEGKDYPLDAIK